METKISTSSMGDFSLFGYTKESIETFKDRVQNRVGIVPRTINFGTSGHLFFTSTYGDVAESEEALTLKLGFLRSPTGSPLSAQQLLKQKIANPERIDSGAVKGNALIVCCAKTEMVFSAHKTLLGVPQFYYSITDGGIICSDRLRCIVRLLDRVELNEEIIPMHFLFRSTPGNLTYYRQIWRLLPGESLRWKNGELCLKLVQNFRFFDNRNRSFDEASSIESLYKTLREVVGDSVNQVEKSGGSLATMLSGGVDSSLLQFLINEQTKHSLSRSYSYVAHAPSFSYEVEYARQASQLFKTQHTFVDIQPEDYPVLITRAVKALAQPPLLDTEPSMLAIAEFARSNAVPERYFVSGQGADTIFGLALDKKLKGLHIAGKVPGARWLLQVAGSVLTPFKSISHLLLTGGDILAQAKDPDAFVSPANTIAVYVDPDILRRCFGDDPLRNALRYRREFAARYLDTDHYLEKAHVIDLVTDTYELGIQRQQLFLHHGLEKIHPFFDDDILRAGFAIPSDARYIKGLRPKYLLKDLLEQKTGSTAARKPKGPSTVPDDLINWMQSGPLRPMVEDIDLPNFMTKVEFDRMLRKPTYFMWELMIYNIFRHEWMKP